MTEEEARARVEALVGAAAMPSLERFAALVVAENERQNLIARPSIATIWVRHMLDSAQLLPMAADHPGLWIDVGTGAGFPGMIIALACERSVALVEPRRRRAEFLQSVVDDEGIAARVSIHQVKVERVAPTEAAVISARAVSSLSQLLQSTSHIASMNTLYLLPKGQSATTELNEAQLGFEGLFHVEQSVTNPESGIIRAHQVRRR